MRLRRHRHAESSLLAEQRQAGDETLADRGDELLLALVDLVLPVRVELLEVEQAALEEGLLLRALGRGPGPRGVLELLRLALVLGFALLELALVDLEHRAQRLVRGPSAADARERLGDVDGDERRRGRG